MKDKVGIPRGMFYYDYYILWENFFNNLGVEIVLSPETNKDILDKGVHACVDEACLPVKVFHGHVDYLKDRVDYIFIPKFISVYRREYCCPKHLGLPDMVRHSMKGLPELIKPKVDLKKSNRDMKRAIIHTGKYFNKSAGAAIKAFNKAQNRFQRYMESIRQGAMPIHGIKYDEYNPSQILLLGHSYNIYDRYINMGIVDKLRANDAGVITVEMLDTHTMRKHTSGLSKRIFWTHGQRIVGGAFALMDEGLIDGIIYISSFGCGMDSVLMELTERRAKKLGIPFTILTIDEQTGEAGINTRIEAFLDMLKWRSKDEDNLPTHGEYIHSR
ncbi:MAG TPA: hypothetical protein GXX70_06450 [Tepidimicrobium sp.]|nr:hypothetical protein [Tepidimicrobium sp.]